MYRKEIELRRSTRWVQMEALTQSMRLREITRLFISRSPRLSKVRITLWTQITSKPNTDHHNTEAATIPLAALTAAVAVFRNLQLPTPWNPATEPTPFVVYGGSTSVGSFAIQLARNSNIHPIISVAGSGKDHVKSLLDTSKGDAVFDYRDGADNVVNQIRDHLKSGGYPEPRHGLDPGIGEPCKKVLTEIVAKDGYIDLVLGVPDWDTAPATKTSTMVGIVHSDAGDDLGLVTCRWFTKALQAGTFKGHPFEVRAGGLEAVEQALKDLKDGKNSARKYVFRIAETPGLSA